MYWSFASWRGTVVAPDSPYRVILDEEVARRTQELTDEVSRLKDELAADPVRLAFAKFHERVNTAQPKPEPEAEKPVAVAAEPARPPQQQRQQQGQGRRR